MISMVVLNPAARGGRAGPLWAKVEPWLSRYISPVLVHTDPQGQWIQRVHDAMAEGVRMFVAAGGDGTVNALVNALLDGNARAGSDGMLPFTLGAVGLGSSNDFHKPARRRVNAIPVRVDPEVAGPRDVGLARYRDERGVAHSHRFVVSASLGIAAEANALFNAGDAVLGWIKPRSSSGAIAYAALKTMARYQNHSAALWLGDETKRATTVQITNLSVMKTPYLSGWLRFDTPVEPADGRFAVNLSEGLNTTQTVGALVALSRGRYLRPKRAGNHHWRVPRLTVEATQPFALELDGEVVRATRVTFAILAHKLRCCA